MTRDQHERYRELVAGHALDALEPEDELALAHHLPACDQCTRELRAHRDALAELAHATSPLTPPAGLFDRIRAEVEAADPDAFGAPTSSPVADLARARVLRRPTRAQAWVSAAAAVSIAAVVSLGVWNLSLQRDNAEQGELSQALQAAVSSLESEPGRTVPLESGDGDVRAVAVVTDDRVNLVVDGLAPNDANASTYVLWGQANGEAVVPLGSFDVGSGVSVVRDVQLPAGLTPVPHLLAVTLEPGRTMPAAPGGSPVVSGVAQA